MTSATFLLAFNFAIGVSFAVAFLALTRGSGLGLGLWCAAGFLSAATTVAIEALAPLLPSVRLTSALSFGFLMLALTAIAAGLARHYRPTASPAGFAVLFAATTVLNVLVVFDLPRGSWAQAIGYQGPLALALALAAVIVAVRSPNRPVDRLLAAVLGLSALQFLAKIALAGSAGQAPGVRDYIASPYAFYSQTAGGILSLMLGLSLVGLIVVEVLEATKLRLQRDALSGLLNRAAFMERVPQVVRKSLAQAPTAVILADLDRFKAINDRFGHAAGDAVIRAFGALIRAEFGDAALCGRLGGEEFCVVLPGCDAAGARARVQALRAAVRRHRYGLIPAEIPVTASFGIALTGSDEPFGEALHRADMALYHVKRAGRDDIHVAASGSPASAGDPFRLQTAVPGPSATA